MWCVANAPRIAPPNKGSFFNEDGVTQRALVIPEVSPGAEQTVK